MQTTTGRDHPIYTSSPFGGALPCKDIKIASSIFIKKRELFQDFEGWQVGYGAFTYSISAKNNLIAYVKNQEEHHKTWSYREELLALLKEHEVEWDERYLE
ncbi:MAG: hypothetical protein IPJ00_22130 [Saprospirales bacterium]|nr:hypothetical protein [Saprospirales bacterium]